MQDFRNGLFVHQETKTLHFVLSREEILPFAAIVPLANVTNTPYSILVSFNTTDVTKITVRHSSFYLRVIHSEG